MSRNKEITGGDLQSLWQVANRHLPKIQNACNRQINRVDEVEYGAVGDLGSRLRDTLDTFRKFLLETSQSLGTTTDHLKAAINAYAYVDETNASELTEAGKDLKDYEKKHTPITVIELDDEPPSTNPSTPGDGAGDDNPGGLDGDDSGTGPVRTP